MQLHVRHETLYRYATPVSGTAQIIRLTPRQERGQRVLRWNVKTPGRRIEHRDPFGNLAHLVTVSEPHDEIRIVARGVVELSDHTGWLPPDDSGLSPLVFLAGTRLTAFNADIRDLAGPRPANPGADDLLSLADRIRAAVEYVPGATEVHHDAAEALKLGKGVCQDHTHVFLAACHALGIPARYVSGYVQAAGSDAASHAWADAWLQAEQRWLSIDITNLRVAGAHHCRLAVGRDYLDACPVRGVRRGGEGESMLVRVVVGEAAEQ